MSNVTRIKRRFVEIVFHRVSKSISSMKKKKIENNRYSNAKLIYRIVVKNVEKKNRFRIRNAFASICIFRRFEMIISFRSKITSMKKILFDE